ncbi:hypothetical protein GE21DRAFT_1104182 [Neurospora crassa]|nr:hypothetical protein GE21DRAFT_1104182 [Neurospora crassa]
MATDDLERRLNTKSTKSTLHVGGRSVCLTFFGQERKLPTNEDCKTEWWVTVGACCSGLVAALLFKVIGSDSELVSIIGDIGNSGV